MYSNHIPFQAKTSKTRNIEIFVLIVQSLYKYPWYATQTAGVLVPGIFFTVLFPCVCFHVPPVFFSPQVWSVTPQWLSEYDYRPAMGCSAQPATNDPMIHCWLIRDTNWNPKPCRSGRGTKTAPINNIKNSPMGTSERVGVPPSLALKKVFPNTGASRAVSSTLLWRFAFLMPENNAIKLEPPWTREQGGCPIIVALGRFPK